MLCLRADTSGPHHRRPDILCLPDDFLLDTEPELREKVRLHILRYKVADQIELEDVTDTTAAIGVEGPSAPPPPEGCTTAPFTVTGQPGYRIYCAPDQKAEVIRLLEAARVSPATRRTPASSASKTASPATGRISSRPRYRRKREQMHAVSFNKGCYLGQEIVERIRARGHVNRHLTRVELPELVPAGTKLTLDGKDAEITSSIYSPALQK